MEVTGKVVTIKATETISEKFAKREIVIETQEQYPQKIMIQFTNNGCALLDAVTTGDLVKVGVNLRGREWIDPKTGELKYFNTIQGWFINTEDPNTKAQFDQDAQQQGSRKTAVSNYAVNEANKMFERDIINDYEDDDVPF